MQLNEKNIFTKMSSKCLCMINCQILLRVTIVYFDIIAPSNKNFQNNVLAHIFIDLCSHLYEDFVLMTNRKIQKYFNSSNGYYFKSVMNIICEVQENHFIYLEKA